MGEFSVALHLGVNVGGTERIILRPDGFQTVTPVFIRVLMPAEIIPPVIVLSFAVGVPEIEPGMRNRTTASIQNMPLNE